MFEGFKLTTIKAGEVDIRLRHGGSGRRCCCCTAIPQTHVMWHEIAPRLARDFTVVAPDLRGYGDSSKPPTTPDHEPYSKRAMARDQVALMRHFGFERFAVAGHDRGGRVAYRLALDHPDACEKLAVLDIIPTGEICPARRHGLRPRLLALVLPGPARPAARAPDRRRSRAPITSTACASILASRPRPWPTTSRCAHDPATIHAMCEDYRAGATFDFSARRGRPRQAPHRLPAAGALGRQGHAAEMVRRAGGLARLGRRRPGQALDCGHYLPEEAPEETYAALKAFFLSGRGK